MKSRNQEIVNYIFWGGITTLFNLFLFTTLNNHFGYQLSNFISWIFSVLLAYTSNQKYVFKHQNNTFTFKALTLFYISRVFTFLIETSFLFIGVNLLMISPFISKVFVSIIVVVLNYVISKILVFNK